MSDMTAVLQSGYGAPRDVLALGRIEVPRPRPGELLVEARASAVNPGDLFSVTGVPKAFRLVLGARRPRQPVRGLVVAGVVAEVGEGVDGYATGDAVYAEVGVGGGGYAEYVRVPVRGVAHMPHNVGFEEAAALPLVGVTALEALRDHGHVTAGQRVLITGASGGVGTLAVQIATALGADVTGVCSGANADLVRSLGASRAIDYATEDPASEQAAYDVILDLTGRVPLSRLRRALTPGGVLLMSNGEGSSWFGPLGRYAAGIASSPFGTGRIRLFAASAKGEVLAAVTQMVEAGTVRPVIDSTFPLARTVDALEHYAKRHARGKVILSI